MPYTKRAVIGLMTLGACLALPQRTEALSLCSLLCSCTIATNTLGLGGYNPINNTPVTATGSLTVTCQLLTGIVSLLVPYTITLSKGQSSTYSSRQMVGPSSSVLNYNLYSDSGMTVIWGDGTGISQSVGESITVSQTGINVTQTPTIYAQIPAAQNARFGMYSDTVTATVVY